MHRWGFALVAWLAVAGCDCSTPVAVPDAGFDAGAHDSGVADAGAPAQCDGVAVWRVTPTPPSQSCSAFTVRYDAGTWSITRLADGGLSAATGFATLVGTSGDGGFGLHGTWTDSFEREASISATLDGDGGACTGFHATESDTLRSPGTGIPLCVLDWALAGSP